MSLPFCNVALPVPLRTTFTYAIPDALRDSVQPGSRVLVPFRNKSLVGVVGMRATSAGKHQDSRNQQGLGFSSGAHSETD